MNSGSSRFGYLFSSPRVQDGDGAIGSLPHELPYIGRVGGGIYVEVAGVSASEKSRNAALTADHVDKCPHVWDKRRDSNVLEFLGKNAFFYK